MSVVTLAEAKTHLNITVVTYDTELQAFLDRAETALGKRIGPLAPAAKTERVRGWCTTLRLSFTPIISLTTVTSVEGTTIPTGQLTVLSGGRVVYTQYGYFASRFYDVTYQAGRASLPDDLKLLVLEMTRNLWGSQRGAESRTRTPDQPVDPAFDHIEQLIAPHLPMLGA